MALHLFVYRTRSKPLSHVIRASLTSSWDCHIFIHSSIQVLITRPKRLTVLVSSRARVQPVPIQWLHSKVSFFLNATELVNIQIV